MRLRCIKAFGGSVPGDVIDGVPDGAAFDPYHFEAVTDGMPAGSGDGSGNMPPQRDTATPLSDAAHQLEELAEQAAKEND